MITMHDEADTFEVKGNMNLHHTTTGNENVLFGYNQTCTGQWDIGGTLSLICHEESTHSNLQIRCTQGTFNVGGIVNRGGAITNL